MEIEFKAEESLLQIDGYSLENAAGDNSSYVYVANEPSSSRKRRRYSDEDYMYLRDDEISPTEEMQSLLRQWGLEILTDRFSKNLIDVSLLDYIVDVDIVDLCKGLPMRYRLVLRQKLRQKSYKKDQGPRQTAPRTVERTKNHTNIVVPQNVPLSAPSYQEQAQFMEKFVVTDESSVSHNFGDFELNEQHFPDLRSFLCSTPSGMSLVQYYEVKQELDNSRRNELVKIIILEAVKRSIQLTSAFCTTISSRIKALFPEENQDTFYCPAKRVGDKIMRASGKFVTRKPIVLKSLQVPKDDEDEEDNAQLADEHEQEESRKWLIEGREPEETVRAHWLKCAGLRKKKFVHGISLEEIVFLFPIITTYYGGFLLNLDFETRWPGKIENFYKTFPLLHQKIDDLLETIKDKESRELVLQYRRTSNEATKNLLFAFLLPALIPTNYRVSNNWRPSIKEAQDGFILHAQTAELVDSVIEERKTFLAQKSTPKKPLHIQPTVMVVGPIEAPTFFVTFDYIRYPVGSILEAIVLAMTVVFSLNLSYNCDAKPIWLFIQEYLFDIKTSDRAKSTDEFVKKLMSRS